MAMTGARTGASRIALDAGRQDEVELYFEDEAPAFDILRNARDPDLDAGVEDRRIGGLGIHLLKTLSRSAACL